MKKTLFIAFCLISNCIWAQSDSYFGTRILAGDLNEIDERLSSDNYYQKFNTAISLLNKAELRILRNTIFAKYGYTFNSRDLQNHFNQFSWYNGTKANVDSELTEADKENIRLIQKIESNYPQVANENIIGCWIDFTHGGAEPNWDALDNGWGIDIYPSFRFYPNGTFHLDFRGLGAYGTWKTENNELVLDYLFLKDDYDQISYFNENTLKFYEIQSPSGKKHITCNLPPPGNWIKISNAPYFGDK